MAQKAKAQKKTKKPNIFQSAEKVSVFALALRTMRLTLSLCQDCRIEKRLKLIPVLGVIGWFIPAIDLIDMIFFVAICEYFIGLCPPSIVAEHRSRLGF